MATKKRRIFANLPSFDGPSCYIGDTVDDVMRGLNNVLPDEIRRLLEDYKSIDSGDELCGTGQGIDIEIHVEEMTDEEVENLPDVP